MDDKRARNSAAQKKCYAANPEKYKALATAWKAKNRADSNAIQAKWVEKNREHVYESQRLRRVELKDSEVASMLHMRVGDCTKELIQIKREQVLLFRAIKNLNKTLKEQNGN